jgi:FixJ family two-component response regulator
MRGGCATGTMNKRDPVVYVIDDDASVRGAIRNLLESVALAAETYGSPQEFLSAFRPDSPGCLILDIRLPEGSGLDFQTSLINRGVRIPIIFITGHGDVAMSVRAMKAGAVEFLTKPFRQQELLDAIYHAIQRDRADRERQAERVDIRNRYKSLTRREIEVMGLVVAGMSNKQIASKIGIQQATVKFHRGRVMAKMRADSVPDLVRMAERLELTGPESRSYATNG